MKTCPKCFTECDDDTRFCSNCGESVTGMAPEKDGRLTGKTIAGNFLIQEMIGSGAMGAIYKAEQISLGKTVAIKLLHRHLLSDNTLNQRFYREAHAAAKLKHTNCISIIDFGQAENGQLFIAMEYIDGNDLSQVLYRDYPLTAARIINILKQVCSALDEAHAHGIIHRDLKPENIMLETRRSQSDLVTVLDFGIAKLQNAHKKADDTFETVAGVVCGTPEYMSPEQARGEKLDGRTDLYSLGIIIYQMLTNQLPYTGETPIGVVTRHLTDPIPHASRVVPNVPPQLEGLAIRLMSKKREQRLDTAMAVFREFEIIEKQLPSSSSGTILGTAGLASQAGDHKSRQQHNIALSENELRTHMLDSSSLSNELSPVQTPKQGNNEPEQAVAPKTRSNLPWALTALLAVAIAGFVAWQNTRDNNGLNEQIHIVPSVKNNATKVAGTTIKEPAISPRLAIEKQVQNDTQSDIATPKQTASNDQARANKIQNSAPKSAALKSTPSIAPGNAPASATTVPAKKTVASKVKASKRTPKAVAKTHRSTPKKKVDPRAPDNEKKQAFDALMKRAHNAKIKSHWLDALTTYQKAYRLIPKSSILKKMGYIQLKLNNRAHACRLFKRSISGMKGQRRTTAVATYAVYGCKLDP